MADRAGNKYSVFVDKVKQWKSYYDKEGIPGLVKHFQTNLNEWKDVHIKVAVTGRSGAGKSSFINAIRDVDADDDQEEDDDRKPAGVGVTECTTEVQDYIYPGNNQFRLYDLPGVGTQKFPQATYLKDVDFEKYDLLIIITDTRFMNEDLWLAQQAVECHKPFYFVRSKIENDIRNDKQAHRKTHNEAALLKKIREDMASNLKSFDVKDIFLIDNYDTQSYDFGLLTTKLIQEANEMKREAIVFSLACLSRVVIEEKKKHLERRIPMVSTFAGIVASMANTSFKNPSESSVVSREIKFYGEQFRVDTASLNVGVEVCDLSEDDKEAVDAKMYSHDKTMYENLKQSLFHMTNYIPVVGNIALGIKCAYYLQECLDETAERAVEIHALMTESFAKKCMT
ncbi:interferon-inducible GTPase 1-like isoform X3 [Mercenaria mercenaria]|uniref:interferon-inducible GTPase 1-like isoform X3 n=1 Tax=Mercenaria mercenaria TaxID=6596 RepID=UPI00234F8965|nr:interferon-inducible GTPase 1-like isoform X3 [Mercenaria mercenaria]